VSESAPVRDTYWLLYNATLVFFSALGGLSVVGAENVPESGTVLMVSNHVSYLDPCAIGDASPRRVVFMAKAELFGVKPLAYLLRGVDSFPVRRGESDRNAFKNTLAMLQEGRVVCIFPEGTRGDGETLQDAEAGAAVFGTKTGCAVVPVFVFGTETLLGRSGRLKRSSVKVAFGKPFTLEKRLDREDAARILMERIAQTRDEYRDLPGRRLWPGRLTKPKEGSRAA
jgi:1-acyl-sn-glycerol-3-phosphate acyltransferase